MGRNSCFGHCLCAAGLLYSGVLHHFIWSWDLYAKSSHWIFITIDWPWDGASSGALLPTKGSDEFKPFIRRLPEFKFWYSFTKAFCIAFVMTFFSAFDVPVFWPILLCYWIALFVLTMRRQIAHMIKYKYVPFNIGKQRYGSKKPSASSSGRKDWSPQVSHI